MARLALTVRDPDRLGPEYTALVLTRRPPSSLQHPQIMKNREAPDVA